MITLHARFLIFIPLLILLFIIIYMVRQRSLELKYVLVWLIGDVIMMIVVGFPGVLDWLAVRMGIYSVANMVFLLAFLLAISICFSLTVALSRLSTSVRKMAQIVSMIPDEVKEEVTKELDNKNDNLKQNVHNGQ